MLNKHINTIRDLALSLDDKECEHAIELLEIVSHYRPNSAFIKSNLCKLQDIVNREISFNQVENIKNSAILKIRVAGIGDMLKQVSTFYWFCEYLSLSPYFYVESKNGRNEIESRELFEIFGFNQAGIMVDKFDEEGAILFSEAFQLLSKKERLYSHCIVFDNACYENKVIKQFLAESRGETSIHPKLSSLVRESTLFKSITRKKIFKSKKIVVHIRRGDVAQINLSILSEYLFDSELVDKVAHVKGIFNKESIKTAIPSGNYKRYKTIGAYLKKLHYVCEKIDTDYSVSLLSDGMTRLTKQLLAKNKHIFRNADMSHWQLENELNKEFYPLVELSKTCLIGEYNNLLLNTIVEGLSADIIISGSPGLFKQLSLIMKLDNEFVYV